MTRDLPRRADTTTEDTMFLDSDAYPEMIVARASDQLRELEHARRAYEQHKLRRGHRRGWTRLFLRRSG